MKEEEILLLLATLVLIAWKQASNAFVRYRSSYLISSKYFDLNALNDEYVRRLTRFSKNEIRMLSKYFQLNQIQWRNRYKSDWKTSICLLLVRLAWSKRLFRLSQLFHKNSSWLSSIFNDVVVYLYERYRDIVQWHSMLNNYKRVRRYAKAISRELDSKELCFWDFIDETFREVARSVNEQSEIYFDYKKKHDIKFQNKLNSNHWIFIH
jgi:hypothetical protein